MVGVGRPVWMLSQCSRQEPGDSGSVEKWCWLSSILILQTVLSQPHAAFPQAMFVQFITKHVSMTKTFALYAQGCFTYCKLWLYIYLCVYVHRSFLSLDFKTSEGRVCFCFVLFWIWSAQSTQHKVVTQRCICQQ